MAVAQALVERAFLETTIAVLRSVFTWIEIWGRTWWGDWGPTATVAGGLLLGSWLSLRLIFRSR